MKLQGLYEIQIVDSHGAKRLTGSDCGGVYPRAELLPTVSSSRRWLRTPSDAAKPAGEWQTLDLRFKAPRFDESGKKVANARLVKVVLNGKIVQENLELQAPTGHAWRLPEVRARPAPVAGRPRTGCVPEHPGPCPGLNRGNSARAIGRRRGRQVPGRVRNRR